jgi:processive 1,2-diacylglycerol beta-glucosyltransferase
VKKILILTAGFGEGHNSAARGIREGLLQITPETQVQIRDIFAETFGVINAVTRRAYLGTINRLPRAWASLYSWIDKQEEFRTRLRWFFPARRRLAEIIRRDRPDVIVSVFPAYPHFLDEIFGAVNGSRPKRVVAITDSITINAIWFRCSADCFLIANEPTADALTRAGVPRDLLRVLGFPVSPRFADPGLRGSRSINSPWRILYMITPGQAFAPQLVRELAAIPNIQLTVTVGRDENLRLAVQSIRNLSTQKFEVVGWTTELPRLLSAHHLLISKAGGATVQEAIAAGCPMIINQVVPGQEEGNARLIVETNSGVVASSSNEVIDALHRTFEDDAKVLREWSKNIAKISRPDASLEIAKFLLEL